jgi:hypothetical protein
MPYYLFKLGGPLNIPEMKGQSDVFKEAKALANELRKTLEPGYSIRMLFADTELAAMDVLSQPRELDPSLAGDDY